MAVKIDVKVSQIERRFAEDGTTELNSVTLTPVDPAGDTQANNYGYWTGGPQAVIVLKNLVSSKLAGVSLGQIIGLTFGAP